MKPEIILVAAMGRNNVIGINNDIPWRGKLPADMAHFQKLTMGGVVVMGRKTWESIPTKYRPLPGRRNVVLTRDPNYDTQGGADVVADIPSAITRVGDSRIFIIGGAELYKQYLPLADRLFLTIVDTAPAGDAYFPLIDESAWAMESEEAHMADEKNIFPYTFRTLMRKN